MVERVTSIHRGVVRTEGLTFRPTVSALQAKALSVEAAVMLWLGGRGSGKSRYLALNAVMRRLRYPGTVGFSGAPTADQTKKATLREFLKTLSAIGVPFSINRKPSNQRVREFLLSRGFDDFKGFVTLANGSAQYFHTLSDPDKLRGYDFADLSLDETREVDPSVLDVVLPCLRGYDDIAPGIVYQTRAATTPNGYDWNYRRFIDQDGEDFIPGARFIHSTSRDNPFINSEAYVGNLAAVLSAQMLAQEVDAELVSIAGAVYGESLSLDRFPNGNLLEWSFDPSAPVEVGVDWGYRRPFLVLTQPISYERAKRYGLRDASGGVMTDADVIVDYWGPRDKKLGELAQWLTTRRTSNPHGANYNYGHLCYDPAGDQVNDQSGRSDAEEMRRAGFRVRSAPTLPRFRAIRYGVEFVRSRFENAMGERRLFIACKPGDNPRKSAYAQAVIRHLTTYSYAEHKEGKPLDERPIKDGQCDHCCDAVRYHQLTKRATPGTWTAAA